QERENLTGERTRIIDRIKAALAWLGIRNFNPKLRNAPQSLDTLRTPVDAAIPANMLAELRRDLARLSLVKQQIKDIEGTRIESLRWAAGDQRQTMVRSLTQVVGVGHRNSGYARARDLLTQPARPAICGAQRRT